MHFYSLLTAAVVLPEVLAANIAPPKYFELQAKPIGGKQFSDFRMYLDTFFGSSLYPLFGKLNSDAQFFRLSETQTTSNGTKLYSLEADNSPTYVAEMALDFTKFASWEPVTFHPLKKGGVSADETGFYITGTADNMFLQWTSKPAATSRDRFGGWLICQWSLEEPQLFFFVGHGNHHGVPSTCQAADLHMIPLPGTSSSSD